MCKIHSILGKRLWKGACKLGRRRDGWVRGRQNLVQLNPKITHLSLLLLRERLLERLRSLLTRLGDRSLLKGGDLLGLIRLGEREVLLSLGERLLLSLGDRLLLSLGDRLLERLRCFLRLGDLLLEREDRLGDLGILLSFIR